jgi:lipase chaperone LimK
VRDTDIDGTLSVDSSGNFVADEEARNLIEYFFAGIVEEPEEFVRTRIEEQLRLRLPSTAVAEASRFVEQYLAYRRYAREFMNNARSGGTLATALAQMRELRREVFGEGLSEKLFGDDDRQATLAMGVRDEFDRGNTLDPADDYASRLPATRRATRDASLLPLRYMTQEKSLLAATRDPVALRQLREWLVGTSAANRLEDLDRRRSDWARRLAAYKRQLSQLNLSTSGGHEQRETLRRQYFSPTEQRRVDSLERNQLL